jgi:carboxylesterase
LGGHGRDYDDFKSATWEDWQQPIIDEYNKLKNLGYQNINFAASSTGCPLVLNMIRTEKINTDKLKHVFFIDPLVVPANKQLSLIPVIGVFIGYTTTTMEQGENGFWYKYEPQHALHQLEKFAKQEIKQIENGITLPSGVILKVYKSLKDGSVDPISAVQLQKGVKAYDGSPITVIMVESNLHVFTRLHGRNTISAADKDLQLKTFDEIHSEL